MISFCVQKLFLIVFFITIRCETKNTCNESCSTKTFYYKDEFSVNFTAKQVEGINYLTINIAAYKYNTKDLFQVIIPPYNGYCANIPSARADFLGKEQVERSVGSFIHQNNISYCSWTISRADHIWPSEEVTYEHDIKLDQKFHGQPGKRIVNRKLNLEVNPDYEIKIGKDLIKTVFQTTSKDLPIYHMNFLKCCNKVYGNDKFQLIVKERNDSYEFTLFVDPRLNTLITPFNITVNLTGSDGNQLRFVCVISDNPQVLGFLLIDGNITSSLDPHFLYRNGVSNISCTWSIPIVINGDSKVYDTINRVYDLQISDGKHTYTESSISIRSSGSSLTQLSNFFIVFLAFWFHHMMFNIQS